jgi:SAM-dependent methyltransferase
MVLEKCTKLSLDQAYWDMRYLKSETGWDIGDISTPLRDYFDQLTDRDLRILIPGCGNAYEAIYLVEKNFSRVSVLDIAPTATDILQQQLGGKAKVWLQDFFAHKAEYDLIVEQTFFCSLDPSLRAQYVEKMYELLAPKGKLVGVLFGVPMGKTEPPFGGSLEDYIALFSGYFDIRVMEGCYNSIAPRQGSEIFMILTKLDSM